MKFQPLILPLVLWLIVLGCFFFFTPSSFLIIGIVILTITLAVYFSLRMFTHRALPLITSCCMCAFLLSSIFSGFSLVNILLISVTGILTYIFVTSH